MKSISAAIVILAGTLCFAAGAFVKHGDTSTFVMLVGGVVALIGLWGWVTRGLNER